MQIASTINDLPVKAWSNALGLLRGRHADCLDLQTLTKQAHCCGRGPAFNGLNRLLDEINEEVERD